MRVAASAAGGLVSRMKASMLSSSSTASMRADTRTCDCTCHSSGQTSARELKDVKDMTNILHTLASVQQCCIAHMHRRKILHAISHKSNHIVDTWLLRTYHLHRCYRCCEGNVMSPVSCKSCVPASRESSEVTDSD